MSNKRQRTVSRIKKKYKRLAAAMATAAVLSGIMLPGIPAATAHASPPPEYKQEISVTATAYAPGAHDNGPWGNKTYLGTQIRPGVIAVDPNLIPLGSRVYIEYPDGRGEYAVAEDTGGAIKGRRIDIAKTSVKEAYKFGMQKVKVYILSTPKQHRK